MLIQEFLTFWIKINRCYYGWNTEFFDILYLCNRIKNLYDENEINKLSIQVMSLIERFIKWVENIKSMIFKVYHI